MAEAVPRLVLMVEGKGDKRAVPELVRRVSSYQLRTVPNPIPCGDIPKIRRKGELERWVTYACRRQDGDCALLVLDCDDDCPVEIVRDFIDRIRPIAERFQKKVGVTFIVREFETLFLYSLESIRRHYPKLEWDSSSFDADADMERHRGAKERLRALMKGRKYKETGDQVRFVHALDLDLLAERSRSYRHFEATIRWLCRPDETGTYVYPVIGLAP